MFQSAVSHKPPAAMAKQRGLSQVYCICPQQPFNTTGQRSHSSTERSFLLDVQLCARDPQPSHRLPDYQVFLCMCVCVWRGGTISMTSFPCEPTAALSVITYLIITTDRICIPKEGKRDISEHLVKRSVLRVPTESLSDT